MIIFNSLAAHHLQKLQAGTKRQITVVVHPRYERARIGDYLRCEYVIDGEDNTLGFAVVTDVIRYHGAAVIENLRETTKEDWAQREGFKDFAEANKVFCQIYGHTWARKECECIYFQGEWLPEEY